MDLIGAIGSLIGAIVQGVATIGIGPFVIAIATVAGFLGFDRLTRSSAAQKEREGTIALKVLNDAAEDRKRHHEEREHAHKQEMLERERMDKFEELIRDLIVVIRDLDQRLILVMKMYGEKPS